MQLRDMVVLGEVRAVAPVEAGVRRVEAQAAVGGARAVAGDRMAARAVAGVIITSVVTIDRMPVPAEAGEVQVEVLVEVGDRRVEVPVARTTVVA